MKLMESPNLLKNIKTALFKWWPTILTLIVVLYLTLWPDPAGANDIPLFYGADKLIHAIMMGGLSSAILFDIRRSGKNISRSTCFKIFMFISIFSFADELCQKYMELGRSFEWADLGADLIGSLIGISLGRPVINRIFKRKNQQKKSRG